MDKDTWAIGIDIGTASIRTCVTRADGLVLSLHEDPLSRTHHPEHQDCITQSSNELWQIIKGSIKKLLQDATKLGKGCVRGIGVDATCSLVVLKRCNGRLEPYPVDFEFKEPDQNVMLWMDHRSTNELLELNKLCHEEPFISRIGGAFLPEMGVPKLKHLVDSIPRKDDLSDLMFMELHDFVSIMLLTDGDLSLYNSNSIKYPAIKYAESEIALDGSTKGWSQRLLEKFGLGELSADNFSLIGRCESSNNIKLLLPIPYAGSRVGEICDSVKKDIGLLSPTDTVHIGHGVIDCYAGWVSTVAQLDSTLSMVAGTSTCYLIASLQDKRQIPGVWGPFKSFVKDYFISELGLSATGALIEHLFKSHPAFVSLRDLAEEANVSVYEMLDTLIEKLVVANNCSTANHLVKHMFLYGNILGNRTPYSNPNMRGAFIGESSDLSLKDLVLKYLTTLEFLALETRQIVSTLTKGGYSIDKISMSGSQFNNKRLVLMIEAATGKEVVSYQRQLPLFTVVKGASMLGFAAAYDKDIREIMEVMNSQQERTDGRVVGWWDNNANDLQKLLNVKYRVMVDMAETQMKYRRWVDDERF